MKKIILIMVCLLLMFSIAACGTTNDNNNNNVVNDTNNNDDNNNTLNDDTNNTDDNDELVIVPDKKLSISYMGQNTYDTELMEQNTFIENYLENKFNIDLSFSPIAANDKDNIDLLITAGNLPDCGWVYSGTTIQRAIDYFDSGVTRSVPVDFVKDYAPNYWEMLEEDQSFHNIQFDEESGEYFTLFSFRYDIYKVGWALKIRLDWMENLNIIPKGNITKLDSLRSQFSPTEMSSIYYLTDEAYTIDEFSDLLYDFTYSDPDMNSENDTTGYVAYGKKIYDFAYNATFVPAFGLQGETSAMDNGWGIPTAWASKAKDAYIELSKWIDLKIVNADVGSSNSNEATVRWQSGKYGSKTNCMLWIDYPGNLGGDPEMLEKVPDLKMLIAPGLVDNDGNGGRTTGYGDYNYTPGAGFFYVNSDVDDEKLARILQLFDFMCIDTEGEYFCIYGEEGVHYTINEKTLDRTEIDQTDWPAEDKVSAGIYDSPPISKRESPANEDSNYLTSTIYRYAVENWPETTHLYIISPVASDLDLDLAWYGRENRKVRVTAETEFLTRVFNGEADIDTAWDNFMSVLDSVGFADYIKDLNENAWLDSEFRLGNLVHPTDLYPE